MANEKQINSRIQHKHDTEANWYTAGTATNPFIPKAGELIIYDPDDNYDVRTKFGDGETPVHLLPWASGCNESIGLTFEPNGDGICMVSGMGSCTDTNIIIPKYSPEGRRVTSINENTFYQKPDLTSIVIPDSVTSISAYAIGYCRNLTSIIIPNSVTTIDNQAFGLCPSLTIYCEAESQPDTWDEGWNYNGGPVVWGSADDFILVNNKFKEIVGAINEINEKRLDKMSQIDLYPTEIEVNSAEEGGVLCFGNFAAQINDTENEDIIDVFEIGAMYNLPIVAGDNVTFTHDTENQVVKINASVPSNGSEGLEYTLSGDGTYYICIGIGTCTDTELIIPPTYKGLPVKEIRGFNNCDSIVSVVIPNSVNNIQDQTFTSCGNITQVIIPKSVTSGLYEICNLTSQHITFYCEAESQPDNWFIDWIQSNFTVVWGFANDFVAVNNKIDKISGSRMVGVWVLDKNPTLEFEENNTGYPGISLNFTCDGVTYDGIWSDGSSLLYAIDWNTDSHELVYDVDSGWYEGNKYRSIIINQEPPQETSVWIKANAKQVKYQTKTDDTLETESKEIVGAINEINNTIGKVNGGDGMVGTWVFNDELNFENIDTEDATYEIKFTCNSISYEAMYFMLGDVYYCVINDNSNHNAYINNEWIDEVYKTITITEEPPAEVGTWIKANAKKQGGLDTTSKTIVGAINEINSKINESGGANGLEIVTTTGTGTAYEATIGGITELKAGVNFIMIPHETSSYAVPTLNVNELGAKSIRRKTSDGKVIATVSSYNFFTKDKPYRLMYDGAYWMVMDYSKPSATDLDGNIPINKIATSGSNAGKVLTTNESGIPEWQEPSGGVTSTLPSCDSSNNGQFLRVVDGVPAWAIILNAEEASF